MTTQMSLKLVMDSKSRRILFAEAGKDAVDFLFSLLYMPMASIVQLLTKERMMGSIGSIYKSVESLTETYLECNKAKSLILSPTFTSPSKLLTGSSWTTGIDGKYYTCSYSKCCSSYCTNSCYSYCPLCKGQMNKELKLIGPSSEKVAAEAAINTRGFVKGAVSYIVMDDLTVMPMSTASTIALLHKFDVKDVSMLEERTVKLGMKEGLELLKACLQSETVLTDVFLGMKAEPM